MSQFARISADTLEVRLNSTVKGVTIEVEDTGIGMNPKEQLLLFDRFRQGKHQRRGNGLGLYLSRQIVEAHQGNIYVSSTVGKGSIFTVYLPMQTNYSKSTKILESPFGQTRQSDLVNYL